MIDWMRQYFDVADDGFKAEALWLSWAIGAPLEQLSFDAPEWQHFAHRFMPEQYAPGTDTVTQAQQYEREQSLACFGGYPEAVELTYDLNVLCHRVIWACDFGMRSFHDAQAEQIISGALGTPDDDHHARACVALALMGCSFDTSRCEAITTAELAVSNYHAQLCARMALIFSER